MLAVTSSANRLSEPKNRKRPLGTGPGALVHLEAPEGFKVSQQLEGESALNSSDPVIQLPRKETPHGHSA